MIYVHVFYQPSSSLKIIILCIDEFESFLVCDPNSIIYIYIVTCDSFNGYTKYTFEAKDTQVVYSKENLQPHYDIQLV